MLTTCFFVIHDTSRSSQNKITKLTGRKQVGSPLFKVLELDVEAGRDNTTLVQTAVELDDDLARTMVVNLLKLTNVAYIDMSLLSSCVLFLHTVLLHDRKELDNDLGGRANHDLALTTALSVVDGVQAVVQNRDTDHVI